MNEGYQDREDPGLTVRFQLRRAAGRVAAGVDHHALDHDRQRGGRRRSRPRLRAHRRRAERALLGRQGAPSRSPVQGDFKVIEDAARAPTCWAGTTTVAFDDLPVVQRGLRRRRRREWCVAVCPSRHRVERRRRGRGHEHRAHRPRWRCRRLRAGQEAASLPVIAPLDEAGKYLAGFGQFQGKDAAGIAAEIMRSSRRSTSTTTSSRTPTGTPLLALRNGAALPRGGRVVHLHGRGLRPAARDVDQKQVDASLRYQIMESWTRSTGIPSFGHDREIDWLYTMGDWMISKKRYWGLALPIWECTDQSATATR